ncbi:hypothetical protein GALMADRAFT_218830 [Galerina marginata CBS 339.88]|uniref:F-box domain-containing protein n=1 Tax=Galerina marginata (strain CBS 339.88) TaxID=685588 RepID=A0A067TRB8_GALM3|nr:hypothetical protein GALMADRAFT_218830 [Galerina marginata CBS 339.88]
MPPKSKKRKVESSQQEKGKSGSSSKIPCDLARLGAQEVASNAQKGLLPLPAELKLEIFDNFLIIGPFTETPGNDYPVLPIAYLERTDTLRALSQVCVAYRREFLPVLWETFNACCAARPSSGSNPNNFFKHIGETLLLKSKGVSVNPTLGAFIRTANIVLTRYQTETVIPKFSKSLRKLPNLHTLHVLHAHTQMTTAIKTGFEGVELPSIRTLIIPGYCHEILQRCPNVTIVWCIRDDGSKLITVIAKHCKAVEEMRGFSGEESIMKRIAKAAPNLRVFDMWDHTYEAVLERLPSFKKFNTLIVKTPQAPDSDTIHVNRWGVQTKPSPPRPDLQKCISDAKARFKKLPPTNERRRIRIFHQDTTAKKGFRSLGQYREVDLE